MRTIAAIAVLAACHRAAPETRPLSATRHSPPAPNGFATCDFVTLDAATGELTAWKQGETPQRLGSISIAPALAFDSVEARVMADPMHGDWADREHLFVRTTPGAVKLVTRDGLTDVAIPDLRHQIPKPDDEAMETGGGKEYTRIDLVVAQGEAWWSRCPWSYANDGGYCAGWISQRLWPDPPTSVRALVEAREDRWFEAPPAGYRVDHSGDGVTCKPPDGAASAIKPHGDDSGEIFYGAHWVSAAPPRLLVTFGWSSEFDSPPASRWELHDGCGATLAEGTRPRAGVDDTWTGIEAGALVLRHGATVLARVPVKDPDFAQLLVRPKR